MHTSRKRRRDGLGTHTTVPPNPVPAIQELKEEQTHTAHINETILTANKQTGVLINRLIEDQKKNTEVLEKILTRLNQTLAVAVQPSKP